MTQSPNNAGVLPVFKSAPILTQAQQIDVWLTGLRNNVVYAFQDKRIDKRFYTDVYGLDQKPVTWAQKTENYIQKITTNFKNMFAQAKQDLNNLSSISLVRLKEASYVMLATAPTILTSFDAHSTTTKKEEPKVTTTKTNTNKHNIDELLSLKDFSTFKTTMDNSLLPNNFRYSGDYLDKLGAMYAIQKKETPGPGAADTPWSGSSNKDSQVGAFGWGQFVATTAIAEGMFVKLKTIRGGKNRAKKAEQLSQEFANNPDQTDMLALPLVGKANKILIVKLSEKTKELMGSDKAMDLFLKEKGLETQHYYFAQYYQGILEKISGNSALQKHIGNIAQTPIGKRVIDEHFIASMFWYKGPKATEKNLAKARKKSRKTIVVNGEPCKIYTGVTNGYYTSYLKEVIQPSNKKIPAIVPAIVPAIADTTRVTKPYQFKDLEIFRAVPYEHAPKPELPLPMPPIQQMAAPKTIKADSLLRSPDDGLSNGTFDAFIKEISPMTFGSSKFKPKFIPKETQKPKKTPHWHYRLGF